MGRNSIKYSKDTPSKRAVKKDDLVIGLGNDNYGPTNITDYYAGIDPPASGYVVYAINEQTLKPYMFVASNSSGLIPIARTLGNKFITTVDEAIEYISNRKDTTLLTGPVEVMDTIGLEGNLDAGSMGSYPGIGNTFYNLADTNNTGSSFNIGYKENGIITFPSGAASTVFLKEITGLTSSYSVTAVFKNKANSSTVGVNYETSSSQAAAALANTKFHHLTGVFDSAFNSRQLSQKIYLNGELKLNTTISSSLQPVGFPLNFRINNKSIAGSSEFQKVNIYSKPLTQDEVNKNYYGANIVTDGLTLAMDAGNLVSYESGSSLMYSMTGSVYSGSLENGILYSSNNGGALDLDGTDDWVKIPTYTFGNGNWAVNIWMQSDNGSTYNLVSNSSGGPVTNAMGYYSSKIFYRNYDGTWKDHAGNTTLTNGNWYMLTWVNYAGASSNLGTMQMFVNGVSDSSIFNSYTTNGGPCDAIGRNWFSYFNGRIGAVQFYNKSLTLSEIQQNFTTQRTRFGI